VSLNSIMGQTLWATLAILAFLAALATGVASMVIQKSWGWYDGLSHTVTIQIHPGPTGVLDSDVQHVAKLAGEEPGVARVVVYSQEDSENLLRPWLNDEFVLKELPIPRLLVVYPRSDRALNIEHLRKGVESIVPGVSVDDHREWMNHLTTLVLMLAGGAFFSAFLIVLAVSLAIIFATRAAVLANRDTLEVLYYVGARDDFIAREFGGKFLTIGIKGATLGVGCAMGILFIFGQFLNAAQARDTDFSLLIGSLSLNSYGYLALMAVGILVSGVTAFVSRMTVYRQLQC
jgi:cell division transport system permease protein